MYSAVLVYMYNRWLRYKSGERYKQPKLSAHAGMQFINQAAEMHI